MRFKTIVLVITVLFSRTLAFPNLAANGSAIQSSVYRDAYNNNYGASKVIDGNTNQLFIAGSCCHTDIGFSSAWWRLDLGYSAYIHRVVMYYRGDQSPRIKGYYLYVSDSFSERNPNSGHECYHYPMSGQLPNTIQNKTCDLTGRYVVYYNERDGTETFVDLCEVEVFGCYLGRYGSQCQSNCSPNCNDGTCSIWDGSCTSCKAGFKGNHCDQGCEVGTYGPNCVNTCNHCKNKDCNQFCGRCTHGCSAGWKGSSCQIRCSAGTFGENCSFVCNCLDGNTCDDVNGHCPHELCDPGWKSNSCSQSCVKGTFGKNCLKKCTNCITDNCNRFNGTCDPLGICKSGWRGQGCNFKCDTGSYGINCSLSCSNCINESCDHLEGICQTVGSCKAGHRGSKCNQSCSLGHFGYKYANKCTGCLDGDCEPFSGNCTKDGCRNDYTGYRCHLSEPTTDSVRWNLTSVPERHDVSCLSDSISVFIPSDLLSHYYSTWRDPHCQVQDNGTHYVSTISHTSCGTTVIFTKDEVIFENELILHKSGSSSNQALNNSSIDFDSPHSEVIPVQCIYPRRQNITTLYRPAQSRVRFYEKRYGHMDVQLEQYKTGKFVTPLPIHSFPNEVEINKDMYFILHAMHVNSTDVAVKVDSCVATPSIMPADGRIYQLLDHGCPASPAVKIYPSSFDEVRFSVRAFEFRTSPGGIVYIHCQVSVCSPTNPQCVTGCAHRHRRDVSKEDGGSHLVSGGPYLLVADKGGLQVSTVVAGVCASVAVVATVIAIIGWKRKSSASTSGSTF